MEQPFVKMHGLGNDFVVLDARNAPVALAAGAVRAIADRRQGVGCDQLITLEASERADAFMRIHNADGTEVAACGNGTRCIAALLMQERRASHVLIETNAGLLRAEAAPDGLVAVDMGEARLDWRDIPLARAMDTAHLPLALEDLADPVGVGLGNPHAVFFVADAAAVPLSRLGPLLEHDPLFPERANISVVQPLGPDHLRLRVWERGVGITRACGTAACATLVAAVRRGITGRIARVRLDGGELGIEWRPDNHLVMTGPVAVSFRGVLDAALLAGSAA